MVNTGVVGVDAIGNTGEGLPELLEHARLLKGRFARVINDPEGKEQRALQDAGYEVQYRIFAPDHGAQDDDAHINIPNAEAWIDRLHAEAIPGANLSIINEPGELTNSELRSWLHRCTMKLRQINKGISVENPLYRHGVFPAWGYGHPSQQTWLDLDAYIWEWVTDGHDLAAHEGYDKTYDTFEKAFPSVIGRQLWAKQRYKPRAFIINEFASSLTANDGWEAWQTETETADKWEQAAIWYAAHGFYMIPFTFRRWKNNFRYAHSRVIKDRLVQVNRTYPVQEQTPVVQIVNMVEKVCPQTSPLRKLNSGEIVQTYWKDNYKYQGKNALWEQFVVKRFFGVDWLCRVLDISQYPPASGGTVYALFEDEALTKPGGKWCPVQLELGVVYERKVWVQVYDAQTGNKISAGSGWDTTYFKAIALYSIWTTFEGVQVQGVVECIYGHDRAKIVVGGDVKERYFYSGGLVGFIDYNFAPPKQTVVTREQPAALPPQVKLTWSLPSVESPMPIPPTYPLPETLGDPQPGVVTATKANIANVRKTPSPSGVFVTTVKVGDTVLYRPQTFANDGFVWTWLESHSGWVSNVATIGAAGAPVEPPIVLLPLPFVSQLGTDADLRNNDCGMAASQSLALWQLQQAGFGDMPLLRKVDNLTAVSPLATNDNPVSVGKLREYLSLLGVRHQYSSALTPDAIISELDANRPVLVLLNYKYVKAGSKRLGHYLNIVGYTENEFIVNDSYLEGEGHRMTRAELESALTDLKSEDGSNFASIPYQGIKLDYAA